MSKEPESLCYFLLYFFISALPVARDFPRVPQCTNISVFSKSRWFILDKNFRLASHGPSSRTLACQWRSNLKDPEPKDFMKFVSRPDWLRSFVIKSEFCTEWSGGCCPQLYPGSEPLL